MDYQIFIAFGIYIVILLTIGYVTSKRNANTADFLMGNRSLNFWLTALSAHASDMSAWLFMAFPMAVFVGGLSQIWIAVGLVIGMYVNWQFVAPKLRIATEKYNSYTLSTYFENRFAEHSGAIRILSASMILLFMTHYISAGLIAMGFLFESVFSIDYYIGISVSVAVIVAYVFMGGFVTVAWTDLFQGLFLLVAIILVPAVAYFHIGGIDSIFQTAAARDISLNFINDYSFDSFFTLFTLLFGWGLGYYGQPHILTKFMGINHASDMYKAKYLGISWQILALTAAAIVGFIGIAFFPDGLAQPELVFVEMVKSLFTPLTAGFILCAIFAANISTMDSQILVSASVVSEDFYRSFVHKNADSKAILKVTRISIVIVAVIAWFLALNKSKTIMDTVVYAWSGLGSSSGPLILMSLYSKKVNKYGAIAGIVVGGFVAAVWPTFNAYFLPVTVFPMIPAFFLSLFSIWGVSAITRVKPKHQH